MSNEQNGDSQGGTTPEVTDESPAVADTGSTERWQARIGRFAEEVESDFGLVSDALQKLVGNPSDKALGILDNERSTPLEDLKQVLVEDEDGPKIPLGVLKQNIDLLRGEPGSVMVEDGDDSIYHALPEVPDEEDFITILKTGGELNFEETDVMAAVKAAIASRFCLFSVPDKLARMMEDYARGMKEPCGPKFYDLMRMITSREHAAIMAAAGVKGSFASQRRRKELREKIDQNLWRDAYRFYQALERWQSQWTSGLANPTAAISAMVLHEKGAALPPGVFDAPPVDSIYDEAESVIGSINNIFSGTGIPVGRALAAEAMQINEILEDEDLPALIGVTSREQMLDHLGVSVKANDVRLARSVSRFILSIMNLPKVPIDQAAKNYLPAMIYLGNTIPWRELYV
ncbi:hypothetical protein ACFL14_00990 [Patescibacteria group bacterium]